MSNHEQLPSSADSPMQDLRVEIRKAADAIMRVMDNTEDGAPDPTTCAYIDGQLEKAIRYLASARAIVIRAAGWTCIDIEGEKCDSAETGETGGEA